MPRVVIVRDIFAKHRREVREVPVGAPVAWYMPDDLPLDNLRYIHNGLVVTIDPKSWKFHRPEEELAIQVVPGVTAAMLGLGTSVWGVIAAGVVNAAIAAAVSFGINAIINALTPAPRSESTPDYGGGESATYGWDGIQNTIRNGTPIPLLFGRHKVAGQYLSTFTRAKNDGRNELYMLIGLCAGPVSAINTYTSDQSSLSSSIVGSGLKIDGNSGTVFNDIEVSYRLGSWDQEIIDGFDDIVTQIDQSQELSVEDTSGGYTYTTSDDVQSVELLFRFPGGLYSTNAYGSFLPYECTVAYRYREDDSSASWSAVDTVTFSAQTRSQYNATTRIDLPRQGKYQIEMYRTTAVDGNTTVSTVHLIGVNEILYDDISYNGVALVGIKALATEQLNGRLPTVTSIAHGALVTVYHPDDDFGADTSQSISSDGKALYGWSAANTAKTQHIVSDVYGSQGTPHTLTIAHSAATSVWDDTTTTGPFVFKEITGDFDVSVRGQFSGSVANGDAVGILCRSQDDSTDWCGVLSKYSGGAYTWLSVDTTDGTTTEGTETAGCTDTYFRMTRATSTITVYTSVDGSTWTQRDQFTRSDMSDTVDLGLVCYSDTSTAGTHQAAFSAFAFSDSTAYSVESSSNPAWVIYYLLTNEHYAMGSYIDTSQIDLDTFIDFADYCNEAASAGDGTTHRRHRYDGLIDTSRAAWASALEVAENARATLLKQGDKVRATWNDTKTAAQLFSVGNIVQGSFTTSHQTPELGANLWEVQYLNEDNDWEQDYTSYVDPDLPAGQPYRRETCESYGITRPAEALRKALYRCKANRHITQTCSFEAGIEAINCEPGDRIEVQHTIPQWGYGGRVAEDSSDATSGSTSITLDQEVTIDGSTTYEVSVRHADTDVIETRTVQDSAGSYWTLTVLTAWDNPPQEGDVYSFGEVDVLTKPFIVTKISRSEDLNCKLECIEYTEDVYDDDITTIEDVTYTALPDPRAIPDDVTGLTLTERVQVQNDKTIVNVIDVTYGLPSECSRVNVYYRENGRIAWQFAGRSYGTQFTISANITHGETYDVSVASVGAWGTHKDPTDAPSDSITIYGRTTRPGNVTNLRVSRVGDMVYLRWDANTDVDLGGYEVRYGASTWATCVVLGTTTTNEFTSPNIAGGQTTYFQVKAYNTSGIYSETATWLEVELDGRYNENILVSYDAVNETDSWSGTKSDMVESGSYLKLDQDRTDPALSGYYITPEIDCGASVRSLVTVYQNVSQIYSSLSWSNASFSWGSSEAQSLAWSGPTGESHVTTTVQFRYGDSSGETALGAWQDYQVGEYTGRYFQFKIAVSVDSDAYGAQIEEFSVKIDVPDLICSADNVAVSDTGTTITFTATCPGFQGFNVKPQFVAVASHDWTGADPGDRVKIGTVTSTTAYVEYYDSSNVQTSGQINFIARGY